MTQAIESTGSTEATYTAGSAENVPGGTSTGDRAPTIMSADDPTPAEGESATGRTDEQPTVSLWPTAEESGRERLTIIAAAEVERAANRLDVSSRQFKRGKVDADTVENRISDVLTAVAAFRLAVRDGGDSSE